MDLASTSTDGTVRLWDGTIGEEKLNFRCNKHAPSSSSGVETRNCFTVFSPDGKAFASSIGCSCDDIKVFDVASGKVKHILELTYPASVGQSGMFSPDHKKFFAISSRLSREENKQQQRHRRATTLKQPWFGRRHRADLGYEDVQQRPHRERSNVELRVWDLDEATSQRIGWYGQPTALSLDARLLASVEGGRTINLWNTDTGDLRHPLKGHETVITNLVFCRQSDCNLLVSFSRPNETRIWDADAGIMKYLFRGHTSQAESTVMAIWPRDNLIAFARPLDIVVYDYVNQIEKQTYRNQMNNKDVILYSPDGMTLAVGLRAARGKNQIELWATDNGSYDETLKSLFESKSLTFSPDGSIIATDRVVSIYLWDASKVALKRTLQYTGNLHSYGLSKDGKILAARFIEADKGLVFWNTVTGDHKRIFEDANEGNPEFVFSPDCQMLATTWNTGHTVQLWCSRSCHHLKTFELKGTVRKLSFSTDGSVLHVDERDLATSQSGSGSEAGGRLSSHSISRAFHVDGEWITCERKPQLWIPPQYRGSAVAFLGNRVALESPLKGLVMIELDPEHAC